MAEIALRALQSAREAPTAPGHSQWGSGQCHLPKGVRAGRGTRRRSARHTRSTVIHLSSASITRARRRKRLDRVATFVEVLKVVLVFSGRMQKAAVWAWRPRSCTPRHHTNTDTSRRVPAAVVPAVRSHLPPCSWQTGPPSTVLRSQQGRGCDFLTDPSFFPRLTDAFPIRTEAG